MTAAAPSEPVAIVGIGCRFPGARAKSFWGQWADTDRFFFSLKYFF